MGDARTLVTFRGMVPVGHRTATGGSFARSGLPTSVLASNYDVANQQLTFGAVTQTFDANGNLLTQTDASGTTAYTWDVRNRLTALTGPMVSATFAYDALGRRITKTINGQSSSALYDGLDVVKEDGGAGEASYLRTLGIDEALSRTDANGTLAYLTDALGSTLALADSGGGLPTTYTYAPFGETAVSGLPSSSLMGDVATLCTLRLSPLRQALLRPCGCAAALHPDPAAGTLRHGWGREARPPQHRRPPGPNSSRSRGRRSRVGERGVQDQAIPATGRAGSQRAEHGNVPHYRRP